MELTGGEMDGPLVKKGVFCHLFPAPKGDFPRQKGPNVGIFRLFDVLQAAPGHDLAPFCPRLGAQFDEMVGF